MNNLIMKTPLLFLLLSLISVSGFTQTKSKPQKSDSVLTIRMSQFLKTRQKEYKKMSADLTTEYQKALKEIDNRFNDDLNLVVAQGLDLKEIPVTEMKEVKMQGDSILMVIFKPKLKK